MDADTKRRLVYGNYAKERELVGALILEALVNGGDGRGGGGAHVRVRVGKKVGKCRQSGNGLGTKGVQRLDHFTADAVIWMRRGLDECRDRQVGIKTQGPKGSGRRHGKAPIAAIEVFYKDRNDGNGVGSQAGNIFSRPKISRKACGGQDIGQRGKSGWTNRNEGTQCVVARATVVRSKGEFVKAGNGWRRFGSKRIKRQPGRITFFETGEKQLIHSAGNGRWKAVPFERPAIEQRAFLVVYPVQQPRQRVGANGADCFGGDHSLGGTWSRSSIGRVTIDPLTERAAFVGWFGIASEEPEGNDKQCDAGKDQQQAFAFPGFHRPRVAQRQMDSTAETTGPLVLEPLQGLGALTWLPRVGPSANPGLKDGTPLAFWGTVKGGGAA